MVLKAIIVLLFAMVILPSASKAQSGQGCYIASQNRIYLNNIIFTNFFLFSGFGTTNCPLGSTATTSVYITSGNSTTPCEVVASLGGTVLATGVYRNYTVAFCPLDDYIPSLFVLICCTIGIAVKTNLKSTAYQSLPGNLFLLK